MKNLVLNFWNPKNKRFNNFKSLIFLILLISLKFGYVETAYGQPSCSSYTTWRSGMWIGPGSYCGSLYGGTTVSYNGRLYTHRGYCSSQGPGSWDFKDAGACVACTNPSIPTSRSATSVTCTGFTANWNPSTNSPTGYLLYVSTVSNFSTFVTGYNGKNVGNVTSSAVTGLSSGVTYYYRVRAFKTGCTTSGNSVAITQATLKTPAQPGAITGTATQCPSKSGQTYSISAVSGATTYTWSVPAGWTINAGAGTTSITVTTGTAGKNGNISVTALNTCGTSIARTLAVTVRSAFVTGTISSTGQTICYVGTPAVIGSTTVASGGDGTITYSWRSSADGYSAAISGATAATYTPPAGLTATTSYRRYAKDNTCNTTPTVSSGTWTVTVRSQFTSGTISSTGETICFGGTPTAIGSTIAASGGDGTITYSWRSSADGYSAAISGATAATYTPPAGLTATTSYRRYAKDNTCNTTPTVSSGTWTVIVRSQFTSGTISSTGETICYGGTPAAIGGTTAASGGDGTITYSWRSSADGYSAAISGATAATYTPPAGLTATTSYRRYAKDNTCNTTPTVSSGTWIVTVSDIPTITGTTPDSRCGTGIVVLGATASAGTINWYAASSGGVSLGTGTSFTTPSISSTTMYYVDATSSGCTTASRTVVTATVVPVTVAGNISSSATVCSGSNSGTLTLSGNTGDVLRWEISTNNGSTWSDVSNTTTSQSYNNLTTTTQYRAVVQSGSCASATTSAVTITVYDALLAGSISGNQTMCSAVVPDSILNTVMPSGGNGIYTYQWQSSSNNSAWADISGQTSKDYYTGALGSNTYYRRAVNSGDCPTTYTASSLIKFNTCSGPGGVASDIILWLRGDTGAVTSFGAVTTWQDQSGNEKHATKSLGAPVISANGGNFHPTVVFDGNSGFDTDSLMIVQMFIVLKPSASVSTSNNFQVLGRKNHSSSSRARVLGFGNKTVIASSDSSTFASADRIRINGKTNTTLSTSSFNIISIDAENKGGVEDVYKLGQKSSGTSYDNLNGEIAEIIAYSSKKTGIDLVKIESYLSVKYGITLSKSEGGTSGNYYNSNGDTIWNASVNSGYHYDVIGVGKDNTNKLNQKQSKTTDSKLTVFVDNLSSSNEGNTGTITNNRSFVMVGHNNASLKSTEASDLEKPFEIKKRLDREWKITNTNFDDNFSLEIEWDSSGTFDLSDVRLLVDDDGDFTDAMVYGPDDGLTFRLGSIIVEDVNSNFIPKGTTRYVTLGSVDELTVLPVTLLSFYGDKKSSTIDLNWETASEINSDYFEILHTTDGKNFKSIGQVNAAGNSNVSKKYNLTHYHPKQGTNYYKLREYDVDGNYHDYKTIYVDFEFVEFVYDFVVYPNPNYNGGSIHVQTNYNGEVSLHVFDLNGKIVLQQLLNVTNEDFILIQNINLTPGVYPLVISSPNNSFVSKTIKLIIQ